MNPVRYIKDGWMNVLTGLGTNKDKRRSGVATWEPMGQQDAECMYAGDDIAERVVDKLPMEALRSDPKFAGIDTDLSNEIFDRLNLLDWKSKVFEAWHLARLSGGAVTLMIDGSATLQSPLPENARIQKLLSFSKYEVQIDQADIVTDIFDPRYGQPRFYRLTPENSDAKITTVVHHTRVLRWDGAKLPHQMFVKNGYWHDSVLNKCYETIRDFSSSYGGAANMLTDMSVAQFKIKDLAKMLQAGQDQLVMNRVAVANMSKSSLRAIILDADGESFDYATRNVSGMNEILDKLGTRLATAAKMPRTVLFGDSPTGMGGTGRHEQQNWYDTVAAEQMVSLKPNLIRLVKLTCRDLVPDPEKLDLEFSSLYQEDESAVLANRKVQAEIDAIYIDKQVLDPIEVARSRFGGDEYSHDTTIDEREDDPSVEDAPDLPLQAARVTPQPDLPNPTEE